MRIIAGTHKRRLITPPKNLPVRPTTDIAKESLFNILVNRVNFEKITALDLFSGTGSIAFELVSRGCNSVTAVDKNRKCTEWIRRAAKSFAMDNLNVITSDCFRFIEHHLQAYDLVFADAPYDLDRLADLSQWIFTHHLIKPNGWLVIEHPRDIDFSKQEHFFDHRHYGKVNFSFFH